MKKQSFKKYHFWFLSGLVPLLVLLTFVLVESDVGGKITEQENAINAQIKEGKGKTNLKPKKLLSLIDQQKEDLLKRKQDLWRQHWEKEKPLFSWPARSQRLQELQRLDLAFWDPIPNESSQRLEFTKENVYLAEFQQMADAVAPTQFATEPPGRVPGAALPRELAATVKELPPWSKVLRFVSDWGQKDPGPNLLWLALEDIWIQRALLGAVKAVNDEIASFTPPAEDKTRSSAVKHYTCKSRLWETELWIERRGSDHVLKGKLKNLTNRLQIMGVGNTMKLLVWLDNADLDDEKQATVFPIEGEFVKAHAYAQATDKDLEPVIKELPAHTIKTGTPVTGIFKVKQKFDIRTVPVRRIDVVSLNYPDARHFKTPLVAFYKDIEKESTGVMGSTGGKSPIEIEMEKAAAKEAKAARIAAGMGGGGTVESVLMENRKRYIDSSDQVRRMPVAISVVLDQMYAQDFLVALANMPLPFQTTQEHWQRFRGTLPTGTSSGINTNEGGTEGPVRTTTESVQGAGFGRADDPYSRIRIQTAPSGRPNPASVALGSAGTLTTVSEGQLTAGLINLSVYGIVSLYTKFQEGPPETAAK